MNRWQRSFRTLAAALRTLAAALTPLAAALALVLGTAAAAQAADPGTLRGSVQDNRGMPVAGAVVIATATGLAAPAPVEIALTDSRGTFVLSSLAAARYAVKISMPRFVTAERSIQVVAGSSAVLRVTLQNALDTLGHAEPRNRNRDQDIVSILRTAPWTQPALRYTPADSPLFPLFSGPGGLRGNSEFGSDYTGSLQLYSRMVETADGATEGVGSQFSITAPMTGDATITFRGQFSDLSIQSNEFEASVAYGASERRRSTIGISLRQIALPGKQRTPLSFSREVKFHYGDQLRWSRRLALEYGADVGSIDAATDGTYVRPRMSVAITAEPHTTIRIGLTKQDPTDEFNRWKDGFDNTVFWPYARSQRFHGEVAVAHFAHNMTVAFAAYGDRAEAQSLFAVKPTGDLKLLVFEGRRMSTNGTRIEFSRDFESFNAGVSFTNATGIGVGRGRIWTFNDLINLLERQQFQMVTARFHTNVALTRTELTAVYRWVSRVSGLPIDPYQTFTESNEPTLSIMVAQDLPVLRPFGGKVQMIVDARNIFEPSLSNSRRFELAQAPRMVKGGVNIRF